MSTSTPFTRKPWPWAIAAVFLLLALAWFGRHLDFTAFAHPDERNKIAQIVEGRYNFNHPLLMLNSVRIFTEGIGRAKDFEFVKLAGRWSSVVFASLGVALLVLVTGRLYGRWIAAAAGVFLLSNPHLFDLAHYFKEDPAFLFGVGFSLFAMLVFSDRPGPGAALFLGLAISCAVSGKYAGALVIPFSAYLVFACSKSRARDLALMLGACAAGFLLINLPAFLALGSASNSLNREIGLLTGEKKGVSRSVPHGVYSNVYWQSSTPILIGLLAIYGYSLYKRGFRLGPAERILVLLPVVYILVLSFLSQTNHRYFLPAAALLACLSAAGLEPVLRLAKGKWIALLLIAGSVAWQAPRLYRAEVGFTQDHQSEALQFLRTCLPPGSVVMVDERVDLPATGDAFLVRRGVDPGDSLESLRKAGFTHVVVSGRSYGVFFKESSKPKKGNEEDFEKVKAFYMSLFEHGNLLKEWKLGGNQYLARQLRVYSLQNPKTSGSSVP